MRYTPPRKAAASEEKGYSKRPVAPFKLHSGEIRVWEEDDMDAANVPFTKPMDKALKRYTESGES